MVRLRLYGGVFWNYNQQEEEHIKCDIIDGCLSASWDQHKLSLENCPFILVKSIKDRRRSEGDTFSGFHINWGSDISTQNILNL